MTNKEITIRNRLLEMARNETLVSSGSVGDDEYRELRYYFDIMVSEGVLYNGWRITAAFVPMITERGRVLAESGGYSRFKEIRKSLKAVVEKIIAVIFEKLIG